MITVDILNVRYTYYCVEFFIGNEHGFGSHGCSDISIQLFNLWVDVW